MMLYDISVVMVNIAGAYYRLGHCAEVEFLAAKTKDILQATGLTKCYVFAREQLLVDLYVTTVTVS